MTGSSSGQAGSSSAVTDTDIKRLLEAFRNSSFGRLDLECGAIRLSACRPDRDEQSAVVASETAVDFASPSVGFFHDPNSSDKVMGEGRSVSEKTALGIIRRVGSEKEMHAGISGMIAEKLVKDGDFVEYGQTLFRIRPGAAGNGQETRGATR